MTWTRLTAGLTWLLAITGSAACGGGQVGEEGVVCETKRSTPLDPAQPSPLGFTAGGLIDNTSGAYTEPVDWADDTTASLSVTLSADDMTARFEERAFEGTGGGELAIFCEDVVVVEVTAQVESDDGRLSEVFSYTGEATAVDSLIGSFDLPADLAGSLDIEAFAPSGELESIRAFVSLTSTSAGVTGDITGQAAAIDGDVATAQSFAIASFGSASR